MFKILVTFRIVDADTLKVEVDLRLEMLSDQMDSKPVKVRVSKSDFIPYGYSTNEAIHPTLSVHCTGFVCKICQGKFSVSQNMSDAFTMSAAEP